jgi:hypothetical protein
MNWIGGAIGGVFLVGLLLGVAFSRQRQDSERNETHADKLDYPADGDYQSSISAAARALVAFAKDHQSRHEDDRAGNNRSFRINVGVFLGVSAYTVFTAVILIFTVAQYGEIHRFNKKQSAALSAQMELSRAQLRQLRADLQYSEGHIIQNGNTFSATIAFKNTGPTPAYTVTDSVDIIIRMEIPKSQLGHIDPPVSIAYKDTGVESADIGAGMTLEYYGQKMASDSDIASVNAGTKKVYVIGIVKYRDWQRFCQRDVLIGERLPDSRIRIVMESGSTSNYTGDPCEGNAPKSTFPKPWDAPRP